MKGPGKVVKKCQGTFNYIFSPQSLQLMKRLGFFVESQDRSTRYATKNIWLQTDSRPFCIQFREIQNEDIFCGEAKEHSIELLTPGFLEAHELPPPSRLSPYKIKGVIIEDEPSTRFHLKDWEFPFELTWASPSEASLFRQLSYKKKFPLWSLILQSTDDARISDLPVTEYDGKAVRWAHLETVSWDLLFIQSGVVR